MESETVWNAYRLELCIWQFYLISILKTGQLEDHAGVSFVFRFEYFLIFYP